MELDRILEYPTGRGLVLTKKNQHFSDCHSIGKILERSATLDEATLAGVTAFALILYLLLEQQAGLLARNFFSIFVKLTKTLKRRSKTKQ